MKHSEFSHRYGGAYDTSVSYLWVFEFEKSLKIFYKIRIISNQGLQNKDTHTVNKRNVFNLQHDLTDRSNNI